MKNSSKRILYLLLFYFLLWILLFEFILPVNHILPKPSIIILSFSALWNVYRLPVNFLNSIAVVYLSIVLSYLIVYLLRNFLLHGSEAHQSMAERNHIINDFILSVHWFLKYVPVIIPGLFLIFWYPNSFYIEFIFALLASFFFILIRLKEESLKTGKEYIEAAFSLGAGEEIIRKEIIWNASKTGIIKHFQELHFYIWSVLLVFEFIKGGYGLGYVFKVAMQYKDLSALFTASIVVGITIFIGSHLIRYVRNKFFHWSVT